MPQFSMIIGLLLVVAGFVAYSGADKQWFGAVDQAAVGAADAPAVAANGADAAAKKTSITALIPAFVGFPILLLATLALQKDWRKHMMHAVVTVALLGTLAGLGRGLMKVGSLAGAESYEAVRPVVFSLVLGVLCLVLLVACIRSFIAARRAGQVGGA